MRGEGYCGQAFFFTPPLPGEVGAQRSCEPGEGVPTSLRLFPLTRIASRSDLFPTGRGKEKSSSLLPLSSS